MIATLYKRLILKRLDDWLRRIWIPRVGDRIEFVHPVNLTMVDKTGYNPQPGDKGTITQVYINWHRDEGYIIALDNGYEINYEFPRKASMKLISIIPSRKSVS